MNAGYPGSRGLSAIGQNTINGVNSVTNGKLGNNIKDGMNNNQIGVPYTNSIKQN